MKKLNTNAESIIALIQEWCRLCWPVVAISSKQDRIHSLFILSAESKQAAMVWSLVHLVVEKRKNPDGAPNGSTLGKRKVRDFNCHRSVNPEPLQYIASLTASRRKLHALVCVGVW
jgi:hypothetical protein